MDNILIMKKTYLFMGAAAIMMAGCASDDLVGDENISSGETPIAFSMQNTAMTRDDNPKTGASAAKDLNYRFIVWGEKKESGKDKANEANLVFENYKVEYQSSTSSTAGAAGSSVSNTKGWEYVGLTPYINTYVSPSINGAGSSSSKTQTIKYWDMEASSYTFTAVSADDNNLTQGHLKITKTETGTSDEYDKGYSIEFDKDADLTKLFVADRVHLTKTDNSQTGTISNVAENKYGGYVKFVFRNFQSKIRFGFYETVPGYNVQITSVKYTDGSDTKEDKTNLTVNGSFYSQPTEGTDKVKYSVTYEDGTTEGEKTKNRAVVKADGVNAESHKTFGSYVISTSTTERNLGTKSSEPTYDKDANGSYHAILPNSTNSTPMTFKVSYKLISEDTKEVIEVTDRQVTVPAVYCQWKPNFAYTYLFKVSDASAELYPITFDAVVEADEVSCQETITEVAGDETKVCITTIGFDGNTVVKSTTENEYSNGNVIYASVMDNGTAVSSFSSTTMKLYTITAKDADNNAVTSVITEAAVANCIKNGGTGDTKTVTDINNVTMTATPVAVASQGADGISYETAVPAEDGGTDRTIGAMKWTAGAAGTYYAIEYIKPADSSNPEARYYKIVKIKD